MDSVTERLCSPEQPIVDYRIVFPPVLVPVSLTDCQTQDERIVCRKQRRRWNLQTRSGILHFKHLSCALREISWCGLLLAGCVLIDLCAIRHGVDEAPPHWVTFHSRTGVTPRYVGESQF